MGPNIFLGWVKIHLPGGLIHFLHGSEIETTYTFSCLIIKLFRTQILATVLGEYEQMFNILSSIIDTF